MSLTNRSSLHEKINYVSLLLIAFSLPFHVLACSYSIAIFVLNQIAEGNIIAKLKMGLKNKFVLTFIGFYLLHIAGLAFTDNIKHGLFDLEKKVSLLVFPLFLYSVKITKNQILKILLAFVTACFILTIIFLGTALYLYLYTGKSFIMENLSSATGIHRVYASMYFLFCIYIITYIQKKEIFLSKYSNLFSYMLIIYFAVFIFLLTSRTMIILTVISFIAITVIDIIQKKKILNGLIMLSLFLSLSASFIFYNDKIREMMVHTYENLDKGNSEFNTTGPNQRIEIWKAAIQVVKENYLGVGTGDTEDALYQSYVTNNFRWGIKNKFNAHNQYLQTLIGLGVVGLLMLLLCLIWPAAYAFNKQQFLYLAFIILFSLSCLTESMLCNQKGIVFYAFFNSLLIFHYPKKDS